MASQLVMERSFLPQPCISAGPHSARSVTCVCGLVHTEQSLLQPWYAVARMFCSSHTNLTYCEPKRSQPPQTTDTTLRNAVQPASENMANLAHLAGCVEHPMMLEEPAMGDGWHWLLGKVTVDGHWPPGHMQGVCVTAVEFWFVGRL